MEEQAIQQIVSSLELVHDPRTSNRQRQEAQSVSYLNQNDIDRMRDEEGESWPLWIPTDTL